MDQTSAQTEKIASYETSRTRRSIVDGNIHSDDSNNDEEYASSGFYVREKTTEKRPDSASRANKGSDKECKDSASSVSKGSDKECKENGVTVPADSPSTPVENGENSEDGESSRDSKRNDSADKCDNLDKTSEKDEESVSKEDIEPENDNTSDPAKESDAKKPTSDDEGEESGENIKNSEQIEDNASKNSQPEDEDKKESDETLEKEVNKDDNNEEKNSIEHTEAKNSKEQTEEKNSTEQTEAKTSKEQTETKNSKEQTEAKTSKEQTEAKEENAEEEKNKEKENDECAQSAQTKNEVKEDDKFKENKEQKEVESPVEIDEEKSDKTKKDDDSDDVEVANLTDKEQSAGSILKEHLEKTPNESFEDNGDTEMEMDEDFDPSLLCPDISMDVDEAPVITHNESASEDGNTSPLPYEATFSTLVDEITGAEVQVDLTPEEMELRQKMYGPNNLVQNTKIHCTACNVHLGSALTGANNRFVHPLLKVLICKNCYHFYTSGEFEKDEDGSELYCRWCGQGGQVLCCSSCEFVFCKRCIRNNFGPRKFKEIRDSDDWNCFRCDRGQLSNLRASCAEFMEYYRTELARAQALSQTKPELMTTDHTMCCKPGQEKKEEQPKPPAAQKNTRKKRKDQEDPDYHPVVEETEEPPKKKFGTTTPSGGPGYTVIPPQRPALPKPGVGQIVRPIVLQQGQRPQNPGQTFKMGNTTFRSTGPSNGQGYTVQRPTVTPGQKTNSPGYITIPPSAAPKTTSPGYITIPPSAAPKTTTQGYIKILPQRMQGSRPQTSNTYTVVSGTNNGKPTFTTVRPKQAPTMPAMKHEWFEKTVRAAARVNSNLSYTLTQLNRQQSQANSVEALAMVHNKLQEVLSTSINSLIQIRKNLRTEFISGIKNIKFPAKPGPIPSTSGPIVVKDDDDVIFVNPPTTTNQPPPPPPPLVISPTVNLSKKTPVQTTSDPFADPKPSTSGVTTKPNTANTQSTTSSTGPKKGGFLKVRSFTSLQSVPSECITIPDDPPDDVKVIEEEDPLKMSDDDKPKDEPEVPVKVTTFDEFMVYNVKDEASPAIKKMQSAVVVVKRSRVVDEIIKAQGLLVETEKVEKKGEDDEKENKKSEGEEKDNDSKNDTAGKGVASESDKKEEKEEVKEDSAKSEETA